MAMQLTSAAFSDKGKIPARFTCDGADISPPLAWSGAPTETRSFALICSDPDAPSGVWYHWAAFDIPAGSHALAEHMRADSTALQQAVNDFGKPGYGGPCPPHGHGTHHYSFSLYALNVEHLDVSARAHCREVEKFAKAHALAAAKLTGLYVR